MLPIHSSVTGESESSTVFRLSSLDVGVRRRAGLVLAAAIDLLQIVVFPAFLPGALSPLNNILDVLTGVAMFALFGWHVAFLPTFVAELIPFVDLFPTWTVAVLFVTRKRPP